LKTHATETLPLTFANASTPICRKHESASNARPPQNCLQQSLQLILHCQTALRNQDMDQRTPGCILDHLTANPEVHWTAIAENRFQQFVFECPDTDETD
jgi:hypothetical protein